MSEKNLLSDELLRGPCLNRALMVCDEIASHLAPDWEESLVPLRIANALRDFVVEAAEIAERGKPVQGERGFDVPTAIRERFGLNSR